MIHKCSSLEYLDVSHFDFSNIDSYDGISNMISLSESINYINLSYVKNNDNFKKKFQIIKFRTNNEKAVYFEFIIKENNTYYN